MLEKFHLDYYRYYSGKEAKILGQQKNMQRIRLAMKSKAAAALIQQKIFLPAIKKEPLPYGDSGS
ncbi:hypothetical protein [Sporomusa aerivorans]|uniref:hypothetical protein n=1 Tax=Sporomusa aerivorans TaxID=204936 RepID=UPI00352B4794